MPRWGQLRHPHHPEAAPAQPPLPRLAGTPSFPGTLGTGVAELRPRVLGPHPRPPRPGRAEDRQPPVSLGMGERPARRCGRGRCHLGPFHDWRLPFGGASVLGLLPLFPPPTCAPPPAPSEFSFPVSFCFPLSAFLDLWACLYFCPGLHLSLEVSSLFSSRLGLTGSSSRPLPRFRPLSGAPSLTPRTHSSLHPRLAAPPWGQLLRRSVPGMLGVGLSRGQRAGAGGGWGGHPLTLLECGRGRPHGVGGRRSPAGRRSRWPETAGYICPAHGPHPRRYP